MMLDSDQLDAVIEALPAIRRLADTERVSSVLRNRVWLHTAWLAEAVARACQCRSECPAGVAGPGRAGRALAEEAVDDAYRSWDIARRASAMAVAEWNASIAAADIRYVVSFRLGWLTGACGYVPVSDDTCPFVYGPYDPGSGERAGVNVLWDVGMLVSWAVADTFAGDPFGLRSCRAPVVSVSKVWM